MVLMEVKLPHYNNITYVIFIYILNLRMVTIEQKVLYIVVPYNIGTYIIILYRYMLIERDTEHLFYLCHAYEIISISTSFPIENFQNISSGVICIPYVCTLHSSSTEIWIACYHIFNDPLFVMIFLLWNFNYFCYIVLTMYIIM